MPPEAARTQAVTRPSIANSQMSANRHSHGYLPRRRGNRSCWRHLRTDLHPGFGHGYQARHFQTIVKRYDPLRDAGEPLPPLATGRTDLAAVAAAGQLYALGGVTAAGQEVGTVERLGDAWEVVAALPRPVSGFAAVTATA